MAAACAEYVDPDCAVITPTDPTPASSRAGGLTMINKRVMPYCINLLCGNVACMMGAQSGGSGYYAAINPQLQVDLLNTTTMTFSAGANLLTAVLCTPDHCSWKKAGAQQQAACFVLLPVLVDNSPATLCSRRMATGAFKPYNAAGARATVPRMYHAIASLVATGAVITAGSNPQGSYLFQSDPAIGVFPAELRVEYYYPWCAAATCSLPPAPPEPRIK